MRHSIRRIFQFLLFSIFLMGSNAIFAQKFKYSIPSLDTLQQDFVIGGASTNLLTQGEFEYIFHNQLTSYWIAFHEAGENSRILDRFRRTQFDTNLSAFYGVAASGIFDLGIQLIYSRSRIDNAATSSMFKVFD